MRGEDIVVIGGIEKAPPFQVLGVPYFRSVKDLQGTTVGVVSETAVSTSAFERALKIPESWVYELGH